MLKVSEHPLCERYDLAMLDLDGVVYIGGHAVPGAPEAIAQARSCGMKVAFVTNNAAGPPAAVAEHLRSLEIEASPEDVVTSAQAAAGVLHDRFGDGARVAYIGADGLDQALREVGLVPVGVEDDADAAVSGYGPDVPWRDIMRFATRVRDGLRWVASNTDGSLPTPAGPAPGHGVLVEMIARFAEVEPTVAGKPAPPLLRETIRRVGGERPLMVGDRLDTDIAGGTAVDVDTLLVMTGVTDLGELVAATPALRPTYIAADLHGLMAAQSAIESVADSAAAGGWKATVDADGVVSTSGDGEAGDWWRVVASVAWAWSDLHGRVPDVSHLHPPR